MEVVIGIAFAIAILLVSTHTKHTHTRVHAHAQAYNLISQEKQSIQIIYILEPHQGSLLPSEETLT